MCIDRKPENRARAALLKSVPLAKAQTMRPYLGSHSLGGIVCARHLSIGIAPDLTVRLKVRPSKQLHATAVYATAYAHFVKLICQVRARPSCVISCLHRKRAT